MKRFLVALAVLLALSPAAGAAQNDADSEASQSGTATTGDVVGGQSIGVNSVGGTVSIDATNESEDVDLESGDATASNTAEIDVGSVENGDSESQLSQRASVTTGDAVGGQVVAVSGAGDVDAVLQNRSEDVNGDSGDSDFDNAAFVAVALSK